MSVNLSAGRRPSRREGLPERVAVEVLANAIKVQADSDMAAIAEVTEIITSGSLDTTLTEIQNRLTDIETQLP
jgi:hypothetical protein